MPIYDAERWESVIKTFSPRKGKSICVVSIRIWSPGHKPRKLSIQSGGKQIRVGQKENSHAFRKTRGSSFHSESKFLNLDSGSASTLSHPFICSADRVTFLKFAHSKICATIVNKETLVLPKQSMHATVVILSYLNLIWVLLKSLHKDFKPSNTAFSSRQVMWSNSTTSQ